MRKELVVFLPTTEDGIECSVRFLKSNTNFVILGHENYKFATSIEGLEKALVELKKFNSSNTDEEVCPVIKNKEVFEVEYGDS